MQAYEVAMKHLMQAKAELQELLAEKDGLALTDQLVIESQGCTGTVELRWSEFATEQITSNPTVCKVLPPLRIGKRGRPSNARDKPPCEQSRKRKKCYQTQNLKW